MLDKLLPELRTNILSRLPVDSLLRFRCVSKQYCAEIDDPKFIKTHCIRSIVTDSNKGVIFADVRPESLYSVSFDSPDRVVKLDYPLKIDALLSENCIVVGNCDGILCFSNALGRIALINPATRKSQTLPLLPVNVEHNKTKKKLDCNSFALGFGYDPLGKDYKVVRLAQSIGRSSGDYNSETMIYSLKSNSWRKIPGMSYVLGIVRDDQKMGFLIGNELNWIVGRDWDSPNSGAFLIVAFNLGTETFKEVPAPDLNQLNHEKVELIGVSLGTAGKWLSLSSIDYMSNIEIYVMKEYGVKESWTKLVSLPQSSVSDYDSMRSSPFSKNDGDECLIGTHERNFVWYSPKDKTKKLMEMPVGVGNPSTIEVFHGSLVPLNLNTKKATTSKKATGSKGKKKKNNKKKMNRDESLSKEFKLML